MKLISLCSFLFVLPMGLLAGTAAGGAGLVPGGGFDSEAAIRKNWQIEGQPILAEFFADGDGVSGLRLGSTDAPHADLTATYGLIPVSRDKHYALFVRYRTQSVMHRRLNVGTGFFRNGKPCGFQTLFLSGSADWTSREVLYKAPQDATHMGIKLSLGKRGAVWYDYVQVREVSTAEAARIRAQGRADVPVLRAADVLPRLDGTGRFRLANRDGVWWLFDPKGDAFWNTGVCAPGSWGENPELAKAIARRYPTNRKGMAAYVDEVVNRLTSWGFNSAGGWVNHQLTTELDVRRDAGKPALPYFKVLISLDSMVCRHAGKRDHKRLALLDSRGQMMSRGRPANSVPDVFNEAWRKGYDLYVRNTVKEHSSPDLIAYFVDNEILWRQLRLCLHSKSCARELAAWLRRKYEGDIKALNRSWNSKARSFEAAAGDIDSVGKPGCSADRQAFIRHVVKNYVDFTIATIRKHDPGRLIVSNRFNPLQCLGSIPEFKEGIDDIIDLFGSYDAIGVNLYPMGGDRFTTAQIEALKWVHARTGRPIIIGEWAVHSDESGIITRRWRYNTVDTDAERGQAYENCLAQLVNLPFVIGAHWYKWANGYGVDGKDARNCGLVNDRGEPYHVFLKRVAKVNARAHNALRISDLPTE